MTTYFDTRHGWLRDLGAVACGHTTDLDARCAKTLEADPMGAGVDFFFRGIAHAWVASPNEYTALAIVHAIEDEVRCDMRGVGLASVASGAGFVRAWRGWVAKHPERGDDPEDLADAAARVSAMCSDAHDLMHDLTTEHGCGDEPRRAAANLLAFLEPAP